LRSGAKAQFGSYPVKKSFGLTFLQHFFNFTVSLLRASAAFFQLYFGSLTGFLE
jgi:hypothetical protein